MSALVDERVSDEVAALEAILLHDVDIKYVNDRPNCIETVVYPSTGNDVEQQYVCITLEVVLCPDYPDRSPEVVLKNARGLADSMVESIYAQIKERLEVLLGQPVVFELIELIRENLTRSNLPNGQCAICLNDFAEHDVFSKTKCYHYFHSYCLGRHVYFGEKNYNEELDKLPHWQRLQEPPFKQTCPICRSTIECDGDVLRRAPPPADYLNAEPFELTPELEDLQKQMAELLARQVARGGVVGEGDNGPPPLTITTAEDHANFQAAAANASAARAREAFKAEIAAAQPPQPPSAQSSADEAPPSPKGRNRAYRRGRHGRGRGHAKGGSR